jgi:hypothetical protein
MYYNYRRCDYVINKKGDIKMKNVKTLTATILIGMGLLMGGCGSNTETAHLVQLDNGKYCMSTGDDYGVEYVKGYSDDKLTNYKMVRVIGKDNNKTVDDLVKSIKDNPFKTMTNIQYIGDAVEYKGNLYKSVNSAQHVYEGQKTVIFAKDKDNQKITIDGEFKECALAEVTKVERDETGHLTHYTYKVVQDMKIVKGDVSEHVEVNE